MSASEKLEAALDYAARGYAVLPLQSCPNGSCSCSKPETCEHPGKHPRTEHGKDDATTDAATIRTWWKRWPDANLGVSMGASGLAGVDVDVHKGKPGIETWQDVKAEHGAHVEDTAIVETPSGGMHLWYEAGPYCIGSRENMLGMGVDTKAEGGYLVVPPSSIGGVEYAWAEGHELDRLAAMPESLGKALAYLTKKPAAAAEQSSGHRLVQGMPGGRHGGLIRLAGIVRNQGCGQREIAALLHVAAAERCDPPYANTAKIDAMARDAAAWPVGKAPVEAPKPTARARVVCMADVEPVPITWLWPARIPEGKIALLIGDPGMGKTMLALDIIARVSRGAGFPDGSRAPAGDVVILTAEDGIADTIRPRLDAAGADVSRVWVIESVRAEGAAGKLFSLADDVGALEEVVREHHARLVMIDPLDSYLRGVDSHRNSEVRGVLAPFAAMLERSGATGLCVHHLNKDASSVNALYRAGGSLAFVAAARAVFGVAPDPDSEGRCLFLPVKLNIAAKPPGLGYRVTDHGIEWDSDPVTCDAARAFGGPKKADSDLVSAALDFLSGALADGQFVPQVALEEAAAEVGIAPKSLKKAKQALGVESKREGFGAGGLWYWRLKTAVSP